MACKTPVITSDLPELREIVNPNKDVLMTKPGDIKELGKGINSLLRSKILRDKLVNNSYNKSKTFDTKKITKKFLELYKN